MIELCRGILKYTLEDFKIQRVLAMIIGEKPIVGIDKRGHVIMYLVVNVEATLSSSISVSLQRRDLFLDLILNPLDAF